MLLKFLNVLGNSYWDEHSNSLCTCSPFLWSRTTNQLYLCSISSNYSTYSAFITGLLHKNNNCFFTFFIFGDSRDEDDAFFTNNYTPEKHKSWRLEPENHPEMKRKIIFQPNLHDLGFQPFVGRVTNPWTFPTWDRFWHLEALEEWHLGEVEKPPVLNKNTTHMCHDQKSRFCWDKLIPPLMTESL